MKPERIQASVLAGAEELVEWTYEPPALLRELELASEAEALAFVREATERRGPARLVFLVDGPRVVVRLTGGEEGFTDQELAAAREIERRGTKRDASGR